jgi:hypothetical protein
MSKGYGGGRLEDLPTEMTRSFDPMSESEIREVVVFPGKRTILKRRGFILSAMILIFHNWTFT